MSELGNTPSSTLEQLNLIQIELEFARHHAIALMHLVEAAQTDSEWLSIRRSVQLLISDTECRLELSQDCLDKVL